VPVVPPTQASVKVVKSMAYRGGTKLWSNIYHLNSTTGPASDSAWHTLMDNIVAAEKAIYYSSMQIVECIGYEGGSFLPISSKTYTQNGTFTDANGIGTPGDCAALLRYTTTQRTSKNHPIYLFNYFHGAVFHTGQPVDTLLSTQKTAIETYGAAWITGFSDGSVTYKRAGPRGAVAQAASCSSVIKHRDFVN
jgi:hypothetical protein